MNGNKEDLKKESSKRIRELIDEFCGGKQQVFADECGVSKFSVSQYVNGSNSPGNVTAAKIAGRYHINPLWVMGFNVEKGNIKMPLPVGDVKAVRIPVLGRVAAGIPMDAIEEVIDYEEIPETLARDGEYFGLKIKGDSMEPKISDGDVVIVRKQDTADDGDTVIALVNGNEGCCKRYKRYHDSLALISTNPAYDPMYFTPTERDALPVRIIGKVVELRAKF